MSFGLSDPGVKLDPVVVYRDQQDHRLLGEKDKTAYEEGEEDILD